jgi:hypothetical protein
VTDHRARGAEWRQRVAAELGPITASFPRPPDVKLPWDDIIKLDLHAVRRADRCLRAADPADEYQESARNARRRIGLAVLARMREDGVDPLVAFGSVLDERSRLLSDRLAAWIDGLGPGGLAALAAEVVTWTSALAAWPPLARLGHRDADVLLEGTLDWDVPDRAVKVRAPAEVLAPHGPRPPERRLLVVATDLRDAELVAGHAALGYTVARSSVPAQVAVLVPASGSERFTVDDALLGGALTRLAAAAQAAVSARLGPEAPATPGSWCRWCARRDECEESRSWSAGHTVRFGGLRPLDPAPVSVRGVADDGA